MFSINAQVVRFSAGHVLFSVFLFVFMFLSRVDFISSIEFHFVCVSVSVRWFSVLNLKIMVNVSLLSWNANSLPHKELELLTYIREFQHVVCGVSEARMSFLGEGFKDISRAGFHVFGFP